MPFTQNFVAFVIREADRVETTPQIFKFFQRGGTETGVLLPGLDGEG